MGETIIAGPGESFLGPESVVNKDTVVAGRPGSLKGEQSKGHMKIY